MSYPIVLLDLDHTLIDTDTSIEMAFADAMTIASVDGPDLYPVFSEINRALWKQVEQQLLTPPEVNVARFEQFASRFDITTSPQEMADVFAHGMGEHGELYEGARDMLDEIAPVARLGLVTNGLSGIQRRRLERLALDQYFDAVVISAEVGVAKPSPEIFALAFEELAVPTATNALMVGDSLTSDIAGGIAAELDTCWYNPHIRPLDPQYSPTHTIASLAELPPLVLRGG